MKVKHAAKTGLIIIIIHLVLSLANWAFSFPLFLGHLNPQAMLRMFLGILAVVIQDAALIIVFSSLSRTKEQQILDANN